MVRSPKPKAKPKSKSRTPPATGLVIPLAISSAAGLAMALAVAATSGRFAHPATAPAGAGLPAPADTGQSVLPVRVDPAVWPTGVSWRRLVAHYGLERDVLADTLALHRLPNGGCPDADDVVPPGGEADIALTPGKLTPCEVTDAPAAAPPAAQPAPPPPPQG